MKTLTGVDFGALHRELCGEVADDDIDDEDAPPTPGDRVLHALGRLYRLHLAGLPIHPGARTGWSGRGWRQLTRTAPFSPQR